MIPLQFRAAASTGNPFADLLLGNIASFGQQNHLLKYYNRYKIFEPYFQDDWHITNRLTLNLGLRVSLFGTYRDETAAGFQLGSGSLRVKVKPRVNPDGSVNNLTANGLALYR